MFKFLKEKVKSVISSISKKIEEIPVQEEIETQKPVVKVEPEKKVETKREAKEKKIEPKKEVQEEKAEPKEVVEKLPEKGFFSKIKKTFTKKEEIEERKEEVLEKKKIPERVEEVKEEKGFFKAITEKITTTKISGEQFNDLFWDLEIALLESNVALEVIEKIKEDLKEKLVDQALKRSEISEIITAGLKESLSSLFNIHSFDLIEKAKSKKPFVICLFGINGSGKTTSIAKLAYLFQKNKLSCVLAAADTFRAAAIQQLEEHANNLNVKMIRHEYGSDSASVAFDAIKHAEARNIDVVLIDTAGRLHSNKDLVNEMKKLVKVAKPDLKIFVGESITGNDCVVQAKEFDDTIGIDGIILAKADVDEKGGAAISISYVTKKPILYLGVGQRYEDLKKFDKEEVVKNLGL